MIRKSLLTLAVLGLSANAFSMAIVNGELLGHKQWSTSDKIRVVSEQKPLDKNRLNNLLNQPKKMGVGSDVYLKTHLHGLPEKPMAGIEYNFSGATEVSIRNLDSETHIYDLQQIVCTIANHHWDTCYHDESKIKLQSGGFIDFYTHPEITASFKEGGDSGVVLYNGVSIDSHDYFASDDTSYFIVENPSQK